jgi:hypothetical protein
MGIELTETKTYSFRLGDKQVASRSLSRKFSAPTRPSTNVRRWANAEADQQCEPQEHGVRPLTDAGGMLAGQLWKVGTMVLSAVLLVGGGAGGALWWSEQGATTELRAGVADQNRAIAQWYEQAKAAEVQGAAARQAAEANGRRYDLALQQMVGAKATTCADAMTSCVSWRRLSRVVANGRRNEDKLTRSEYFEARLAVW